MIGPKTIRRLQHRGRRNRSRLFRHAAGDAGLTAKTLGHPNPTLLKKDYNNAVTRAEAESFWSIAPVGVKGEGLYVV